MNTQSNSEALPLTNCSLSLAELLAWADGECAKIECESWPIADTGDYDSAWCVYAHHLDEKEARCVGGGPTIERALRAAWIEEHYPENVKEHAPLSARANVDHGVEVEGWKGHENRAADRGCMSRLISSLSAEKPATTIVPKWNPKRPRDAI